MSEESKSHEKSPQWNADDLAKLVGLTETSPVHPVVEENIIAGAELFDEPIEDPHQNLTPKTLAKNPLAKLGFVAAGLLVAFGIGGVVLSTMMNPPSTAKKPQPTASKKEMQTVVVKKDSKEGELKTQLAISTQAEQLKKIDDESRARKKKEEVKPTVKPSPSTSPSPSATKQSDYAPSSYRQPPPAPTPQPAPVYRQPPPAPVYRQQPIPPPQQPRAQPAPSGIAKPAYREPVSQVEEKDQLDQWNKLAAFGSYGEVSQESSEVADKKIAPLDVAEERIILEVPSRILQPGTSASAQISVPVVWQESSKDEQLFAVILTKPLIDAAGHEAIAAGQQLMFSISSVDGNGLVVVKTVSLIDQQGRSLPISPAFSIATPNGKPLVAQKLFDTGSRIAAMDLGIAGLGALAQVGKIMNQPKQQSSTSTNSGAISINSISTSSDPNLAGAIMEGAATPVLESVKARNQAALAQMQQQQNAWFLSAGMNVKVVVTQPLEL